MGSPAVRILRYRPDTQAKANSILGLQVDILPNDVPIDPPDAEWWVAVSAEDETQCLGFGAFKVCKGMPYGYLARSGVSPASRGHGIQRKLILAREQFARRIGMTHMVSDTARFNYASSNSLIRAGYKLYDPLHRWSFDDGNYWIKRL